MKLRQGILDEVAAKLRQSSGNVVKIHHFGANPAANVGNDAGIHHLYMFDGTKSLIPRK